jgi:Zn-finger nucleic acid-binding protein
VADAPYRSSGRLEPSEYDEPEPDPNWPLALRTWRSRHDCPRCAASLTAARSEGIRVDGCAACGGVWLASEDAQEMMRTKNRAAASLAALASRNATVRSVATAPIRCLVCDEQLERVIVPPTDIEIDVCKAHGTWFDRAELERIVDSLMPPSIVPVPAPPAPAPTARELLTKLEAEGLWEWSSHGEHQLDRRSLKDCGAEAELVFAVMDAMMKRAR